MSAWIPAPPPESLPAIASPISRSITRRPYQPRPAAHASEPIVGLRKLFDGDRGDMPVVLHAQSTDEGHFSVSQAAVFELSDDFVHEDGTTAELSGTFEDLDRESVEIEVSAGDLDDRAAKLTPGEPDSITKEFDIHSGPRLGERLPRQGFTSLLPELASAELGAAEAAFSIPVANPNFEDWDQIALFEVSAEQEYDAGGSNGSISAKMSHSDELGSLAADPITMPLSAVGDVEVDGRDASQDLDGVGTTPEVSWTAPSQTPSASEDVAYRVEVRFAGEGSGDSIFFETRAYIHTTDTRVRIPPGILEEGDDAVFSVRASTGVSARAPFKPTTPYTYAERLTALIEP